MTTPAFEYGLEAFLSDGSVHGRVGLVTNNTGRDRHGRLFADRLAAHQRLRLTRLFSPEHGFGSDAPDGEPVEDGLYKNRIPIVSLYGAKKAPEAEDLADIDLLVFDIQDVGVRFYTYISTLRNIVEAAARYRKPLHVLDRPNPIGLIDIEGPTLSPGFESFVGHLPIPLRYALTPAELALWWNSRLEEPAEVIAWRCRGYNRRHCFCDLGVPWCKPSPSMSTPDTARFYPGTCLFEGLNVSEGRGTDAPFQILGGPMIDPEKWLKKLTPHLPETVRARPVEFRPTFSKFAGEVCQGLHFTTAVPILSNAVHLGLIMIQTLLQTHPDVILFPQRPDRTQPFFDLLAGNSWVREGLLQGTPAVDLASRAQSEVADFSEQARQFHLYQ